MRKASRESAQRIVNHAPGKCAMSAYKSRPRPVFDLRFSASICGKWLISREGKQIRGGRYADVGLVILQFPESVNARCYRDHGSTDTARSGDVCRRVTHHVDGSG